MKFSVVIPTYNRKELLARAISSVLKQTYQDFELIVVDDESTDGTDELVATIKDPRVSYLKIEHGGVSRARNAGIKKCTSEWIAFLDSDDEWLEQKLQLQFDFISKHSDIPLVHGEEIWIRKGKRVNQKNIHKKFGGDIFVKCLPLCLISPSAAAIRKDVLIEMGCFDEEYIVCEDYDLWLKITSIYSVGFIEIPIIKKYGGHEDQLSAKYFAMDYYRIKAMSRILELRALSTENRKATLETIIKKGEILLAGYRKHNNMKDYDEIEMLVTRVKNG